jgi:hypothetical protein
MVPDKLGSTGKENRTMKTWEDVKAYISKNHKYEEENGIIRMDWTLDGGRSQRVLVRSQVAKSGIEWVEFVSFVGSVPNSLLPKALTYAFDSSYVAALAMIEGELVVRNSCLLSSFSEEEFNTIMVAVTQSADAIERDILGQDAR